MLLVVLDTVRADHLRLYGHPQPTSPTLDALAADAIVYRNAIAPGTWTPPSHASLFTGLTPSVHGVDSADDAGGIRALHASVPTLAERLHAAGYRTAAFIGNRGYLHPLFGLARGFETYRHVGLGSADRLAGTLVPWLERRRGRPVFVFANFFDAHEPYEPPPPYDRMFPDHLDRPVARHPNDEVVAHGRLPGAEEAAHYRGRYDGEIRHADDRLGDVLGALRRLGRYDDALVIVTADHGELFGEHGRWGHGGDPVRELVHVPLIVKYPGRARVGVEERPVSLTDVAPTILAVLGLPPLGPNQRPLWLAGGVVVSEHLSAKDTTRLTFAADGHERLERIAREENAGVPYGPVVVPRAGSRLAERLRRLGYVE